MDTCATRGDAAAAASSPSRTTRKIAGRLQQEPGLRAERRRNSLPNARPPEELRERPVRLPGQADAGHPAQPLRRLLRRRRRSSRRSSARRSARPTSRALRGRPNGNSTAVHPDEDRARGRALRRGPGLLLRAPPRDHPRRRIGTRALRAGDIVNVIVHAGGLQQEFRYRIAATQDDADQEARARRRRRGLHGRLAERDPAGYDTAPRYLAQHVDRARGRRLRGRDLQHRRAAGERRLAERRHLPAIKYPTYLGVLSHFDAVDYYTGDDFVPQDSTETNPRRLTQRHGADRLARDAPWAHKG